MGEKVANMDKVVWKGTVFPGKLAEYRRRHDNLWPEMRDMFQKAGIHNYTIWNCGNELFGYYECEDVKKANAVKQASSIMERWSESMTELMRVEAQAGTEFSKLFSLE